MISPVKSDSVVGPAPSHVLETEIEGEVSLYNPRNEQVTILNGTASDIWRLIDGEHSIAEITSLLASSYGIDPAAIADDVSQTIDRLSEAGLIESP